MLLLLPPSEGKTGPARGRALDLGALSFPDLAGPRRAVLEALVGLASGDPVRARETLGLSARQDAEVDRDAGLWAAPTAPAITVYTGVLFEALGWHDLAAPARRRAGRWLVISSALFGLLRPADRIPAYRLSAATTLPGLGALAATWRAPVGAALAQAAGRRVVVDLRSGAYVALGPVPATLADRTVTTRVLHERAGRRTVVSHHNKATKGRLVRALLEQGEDASSPADLAGILGAAGYRVDLAPPARDDRPWTLDVVVADL